MLYVRFASPIFSRARAKPMVRMSRPMRLFWSANTCSTTARTFDLRPLARRVRAGIGRRGGFLRWTWDGEAVCGHEALVGLGTIGGIGPDGTCRVALVEQTLP